MSVMGIIYGLTNIGCAIVFIAVSIPLVRRKIPMNHWYGIRIAKSFRSDADWYAINEYGGRQMIYWSIPLIPLGLVYLLVPWGPLDTSAPAALIAILPGIGPMLACVTGALIKTVIHASKL
jgi:hypothetical protein